MRRQVELQECVNFLEGGAAGQEDDVLSSPVPSTREAVADYARALMMDESLTPAVLKKQLAQLVDLLPDVVGDEDVAEAWDSDAGDLLEGGSSSSEETKEWLKGLLP